MDINEFRKQHKHLPSFLKDFHDEKDFFKAMYDMYAKELERALPAYNWRDNHIFCLDFFLWFCALHGYGLQKLRAKDVQFRNIKETIKSYNEKSLNAFSKILNSEQNVQVFDATKADQGTEAG